MRAVSLPLCLAVFHASAAMADDAHSNPIYPHSHIHSPAETDENHGPIVLDMTYVGEFSGVASGGLKRGGRYLDNFDIVAEADLGRIAGLSGTTVLLYGLYNNGKSLSALSGDSQVNSNIETGVKAFRLYEAWINQQFGERTSLRFGLYDLNSEFDTLDTAGLFTNGSFGMGTDFGQSGQNGPSVFPFTSLAARFDVEPANGWKVRTAILDGVPGDPSRPKRTSIKLGKGDGALLVGEIEAPLKEGKLLLGHWRYTGEFDRFDGSRGQSNDGFYLRGETHLSHEKSDPDQGLASFFRLGFADGRMNQFGKFASIGINYRGPFSGRDSDELGFAVAAAFTSQHYRLSVPSKRTEVVFEMTYRAPVTSWLTLQPDAQYVANPGAATGVRNAFILALRAELNWRLVGQR